MKNICKNCKNWKNQNDENLRFVRQGQKVGACYVLHEALSTNMHESEYKTIHGKMSVTHKEIVMPYYTNANFGCVYFENK